MEKRSRKSRILRIVMAAISTPVMVIGLLSVLLYIPPVQRWVIDKVCSEIHEASGYEIEIGTIRLDFPLKLKATELKVSKNDSIYLQGEHISADISLLPLFTGELEINQLSLEKFEVNTRDMLEAACIDGKIGYARVAARDIDFSLSTANINQLHIQEADINITIPDSIPVNDSPTPQWIINLQNGSVKDSRISLQVPSDSIRTVLDIEKMQVKNCCADLTGENYTVGDLLLNASRLKYDKGYGKWEDYPIEHLDFKQIALKAGDIFYAKDSLCADIADFTLEQPGGVAITSATASLTNSNDTLRLQRLEISSRNGSRIHGNFIIPQQTMFIPIDKEFTAGLQLELHKQDLARFTTPDVYEHLALFDDEMLNANIEMSGTIHNIRFDTITMKFPGIGKIKANGYIKKILKSDNIDAFITFDAEVENIGRIIDHKNYNDSIAGNAEVDGNIHYHNNKLIAKMTMNSNAGNGILEARYNFADTTYSANLETERLALASVVPEIPLHNLTMCLDARGKGIDIFDRTTKYNIDITIDTLYYSDYRFRSLNAKATQQEGLSRIDIEGKDKSLMFGIQAETNLKADNLMNHTTIELAMADLKELGFTDTELKTSTNIDIAATSDLRETHTLRVTGKETGIYTASHNFRPENLLLELGTSPKFTDIRITNGDFNADGRMECGYKKFFTAIDRIGRMYSDIIYANGYYTLHDIEKVLPEMSMHIECGEKNMFHNYLAFKGIETESIDMDLAISPSAGLGLNGNIYKFGYGDIKLDSIKISTIQELEKLNYFIGVGNLSMPSLDEANNYSASLSGYITNDTITSLLNLRDNINELNSRIGATTHFTPRELELHFDREAILFGRPFVFNDSNYINIGKGYKIEADVLFENSAKSGFHLYTTPGMTAGHDVNLKVFNVQLDNICNSIPGLPKVAGNLLAEINYKESEKENRISCDIKVDSLAYDGNSIGNERIGFTYKSNINETGNIELTLKHNELQIAHISSDLETPGYIFTNGNLSLTGFPLAIANAFTGESGVSLEGYLNGNIDFSGTANKLRGDGYMRFDSTNIQLATLGATLHPAEENIMIENSRIYFNKFHVYDNANSPFIINGSVDIATPMNPTLNLILGASNYEILNTPRQAGKSIYGKLSIDLRSIIRGTLDNLRMIGDVTILSNSNFAYVLPETAFETEKELDGLVDFVNFNDTTEIGYETLPEVDLGDIAANFNILIKEGAKVGLDLDATHENYIIFEGDGTLNATYNQSGLNVTGIYKLNSGDLKLTLPIIPLKTFHIQEGGRLTWTGDLYNPTLDITALEKTTVSVELEDNSIQPVTFYTGVVLSNTVEDMEIDFTMSSPENSIIQEQLNQLDQETLSKYAVAMIITGTYLGGRQGVTATNALSSFLDAKINDISGEAIKNFDVNIGINDGLDAQSGSSYKNYSFSFSKRFLNDKITVVIGGEVSSGDRPDRDASNSSIINNVSLEWKLNDSGNRYMRIFYDKNYRSILEGEITETGIGYIYKRKLNKLKELFTFKKKKKKATDDTPQKESK